MSAAVCVHKGYKCRPHSLNEVFVIAMDSQQPVIQRATIKGLITQVVTLPDCRSKLSFKGDQLVRVSGVDYGKICPYSTAFVSMVTDHNANAPNPVPHFFLVHL